jgi:UDP-N-acetylglucosamine 2-epimerase
MADSKVVTDLVQKTCVVGTRSAIIKMNLVTTELADRNLELFIDHVGQHCSYRFDRKMIKRINKGERVCS